MLDGPLVFVDIDTQRDFLEPSGTLFIPGSEPILAELGRLTDFGAGMASRSWPRRVRTRPMMPSCNTSSPIAWWVLPARSGWPPRVGPGEWCSDPTTTCTVIFPGI